MRAVRFNEFGGPEILHLAEVPDPHPGQDEIRVAARACGVSPVDWISRPLPRKSDLGGPSPFASELRATVVPISVLSTTSCLYSINYKLHKCATTFKINPEGGLDYINGKVYVCNMHLYNIN